MCIQTSYNELVFSLMIYRDTPPNLVLSIFTKIIMGSFELPRQRPPSTSCIHGKASPGPQSGYFSCFQPSKKLLKFTVARVQVSSLRPEKSEAHGLVLLGDPVQWFRITQPWLPWLLPDSLWQSQGTFGPIAVSAPEKSRSDVKNLEF